MRSSQTARAALVLLFLSSLGIGLLAFAAPRTFYDDFPFLAHWVDLLPPYNSHLITDVGGLYLGFAVVLAWAARTLDRNLIRAACAAWLLTATLHLLFHATHLDDFGTADAIAELTTLALLLLPPVVAVWATGEAPSRP